MLLLTGADFGIAPNVWDLAKRQATNAMIETARRHRTMTYADLVGQISAVDFLPYDRRLFHCWVKYLRKRMLPHAECSRLSSYTGTTYSPAQDSLNWPRF